MKLFAARLRPGADLKDELGTLVKAKKLKAGFIISCVGSLTKATLRMADEKTKTFNGPFEIVSLVGTLSQDGNHLHLSISDANGNTIGGHLKEGCLIHTTVELIIGIPEKLIFSREYDDATGFKELRVRKT